MALDRFKKESQDLADLKGSREDLMRQIAGKDGEAKRMANAREQADKEKKKLYSEKCVTPHCKFWTCVFGMRTIPMQG